MRPEALPGARGEWVTGKEGTGVGQREKYVSALVAAAILLLSL